MIMSSKLFDVYLDKIEEIIRRELNPHIYDCPEKREDVLRRVKVALAPKRRKNEKRNS